MSSADDPARASYVEGLERKAGKPLDELLSIVADWGPGKHGELVARAKETLGIGHGHANLLIAIAREQAEAAAGGSASEAEADPLDRIYAGSKASLRPLHEAIMARLAAFGPFEIAPKKAYVSLRRSKQFAMVGPGSRGRLEVGVNHRTADGTDRFEKLGPGKMCSHRVYVTEEDEIDDELLAFLGEAYQASA